jgi:hypothetical protein
MIPPMGKMKTRRHQRTLDIGGRLDFSTSTGKDVSREAQLHGSTLGKK